jgi:hypothetical protein
MHYFGAYSAKARARRKARGLKLEATSTDKDENSSSIEPKLSPTERAALRRRWANLMKRVFKTHPLLCECGGKFRILAFITEPKLIARILEHLDKRNTGSRDPPQDNHPAPSGSSS